MKSQSLSFTLHTKSIFPPLSVHAFSIVHSLLVAKKEMSYPVWPSRSQRLHNPSRFYSRRGNTSILYVYRCRRIRMHPYCFTERKVWPCAAGLAALFRASLKMPTSTDRCSLDSGVLDSVANTHFRLALGFTATAWQDPLFLSPF